MADNNRLGGRRDAANLVEIPDLLQGPHSAWEDREVHSGPMSDSRGAADMTYPVEGEPNDRGSSPPITGQPPTDD